MSLFRSEPMTYLQVYIPVAVAEEFCDRMAREGNMEFTDLNEDFQPFQREYTKDIVKIQEVQRQVKSIEELLTEYEIKLDSNVDRMDIKDVKRPNKATQIVQQIEDKVGETYKKLTQQVTAEKQLRSELGQQQDRINVLNQLSKFLANKNEAQLLLEQKRDEDRLLGDNKENNKEIPLLPVNGSQGGIFADSSGKDVGFKYMAGVVTNDQRVSFERQVFLTTRGNSFIQFDDEKMDDGKLPFIIFFLGDQLKRSLKRLCSFMNVQLCYDSDNNKSRDELMDEANNKRNDFYKIHLATKSNLNKEMRQIQLLLKNWKIALLQEKSIRITLNKFSKNQGNNLLTAQGWCPTNKVDNIDYILQEIVQNKGVGKGVVHRIKPKSIPPTHFETNDFTGVFQEIVSTYGVPRYQEFNPAVPTIMTFPFLFAVMYGDVFHGSFVLLAGTLMVISYRWLKDNKDFQGLMYVRWLFFLMGLFAVYMGMIYNDVASIMMNNFNGAQWGYGIVHKNEEISSEEHLVMIQHPGVYGFGIDPTWHALKNTLAYGNSLKMKLSVTLGVTQMTFGLFLKLSNHINEHDIISIFCEFIPQLIFMLVFFGYMILLIIYKWTIDWSVSPLTQTPNLITVLIKMILNIGSVDEDVQIFNSNNFQKNLQLLFIVLMVLSIPWMLIPKPFLLKRQHENAMKRKALLDNDLENGDRQGYGKLSDNIEMDEKDDLSGNNNSNDSHDNHSGGHGGHGHGDEFEMSEVVIHQLIHTIEYVLGTISNTASYLRLWALSLAHQELSEVFYEKILKLGLENNVILNIGTQFMFLMVTLGVLLVMDVLECFLHALRLHWVEFQNKFFYADGVAFKPFTYAAILDEDA